MLQRTYRALRASLPLPLLPLLITLTIAYTHTTSSSSTPPPPPPHYIQSSPYSSAPHLLDLSTLTKPHALLAQALQHMDAATERYALTPYKAAFNWAAVIAALRDLAAAEGGYVFPRTSFYIIVFRSQIEPGTDRAELGKLDEAAHVEAVESGWLLKYWFGVPDAEGFNLATCVWRDIEDAKKGGRGKGHREAMRAVKGFYKKWEVERLALVVGEGAREWDIVGWGERDAELGGPGGEL